MEFVKARLLNEAVKRQFNVETVKTSTAFSGRIGKPGNTGRFVFKCHACRKPGHKRINCPENKGNERLVKAENQKKKSTAHYAENQDDTAFITGDVNLDENFQWILDSGASEHMVNNKKYLQNIRKLNSPIVINVAKSGVSLTSDVIGDLKIFVKTQDKQLRYTVHHVLYVPRLFANLFCKIQRKWCKNHAWI